MRPDRTVTARSTLARLAVTLLLVAIGAGTASSVQPVATHHADRALAASAPDGSVGPGLVAGVRRAPSKGDVLVNDPSHAGEAPGCTVQSEPSVVSYGSDVYVGFNDGQGCVSEFDGQAPLHFTGFSRSTDGGRHFTDLGPLVPSGSIASLDGDAVLAVDTTGPDAGTLYLASLATDKAGTATIAVGTSTDRGRTFRWHNLDPHALPVDFQDKEWIAIDNTGGPRDGDLYVTWTDFASNASIVVSTSSDDGSTWSSPRLVAPGNVQGSQPAVGPTGELDVVWEVGFGGAQVGVPPTVGNAMSIWWARSNNGAASFSKPVQIAAGDSTGHEQVCGASALRDVLNGDIRSNEFPSIAVDTFGSAHRGSPGYNPSRGTVYVVYGAKGKATGDESDVYMTRLAPGAGAFTNSVRLNDDHTSTDQFFPSVTVPGPGEVAVMWTDRRQDASLPAPAGNRLMDQWLAVSRNGGRSFARDERFSSVLFPPAVSYPNSDVGVASCYAGDYDVLSSSGHGDVVGAWGDNRDGVQLSGQSSPVPDPNVYFHRLSFPRN